MPVFRWLHACGLPAGYDLRRRGWTLKSGSGPDADTVALADVAQLRGPAWPVFLASIATMSAASSSCWASMRPKAARSFYGWALAKC